MSTAQSTSNEPPWTLYVGVDPPARDNEMTLTYNIKLGTKSKQAPSSEDTRLLVWTLVGKGQGLRPPPDHSVLAREWLNTAWSTLRELQEEHTSLQGVNVEQLKSKEKPSASDKVRYWFKQKVKNWVRVHISREEEEDVPIARQFTVKVPRRMFQPRVSEEFLQRFTESPPTVLRDDSDMSMNAPPIALPTQSPDVQVGNDGTVSAPGESAGAEGAP